MPPQQLVGTTGIGDEPIDPVASGCLRCRPGSHHDAPPPQSYDAPCHLLDAGSTAGSHVQDRQTRERSPARSDDRVHYVSDVTEVADRAKIAHERRAAVSRLPDDRADQGPAGETATVDREGTQDYGFEAEGAREDLDQRSEEHTSELQSLRHL